MPGSRGKVVHACCCSPTPTVDLVALLRLVLPRPRYSANLDMLGTRRWLPRRRHGWPRPTIQPSYPRHARHAHSVMPPAPWYRPSYMRPARQQRQLYHAHARPMEPYVPAHYPSRYPYHPAAHAPLQGHSQMMHAQPIRPLLGHPAPMAPPQLVYLVPVNDVPMQLAHAPDSAAARKARNRGSRIVGSSAVNSAGPASRTPAPVSLPTALVSKQAPVHARSKPQLVRAKGSAPLAQSTASKPHTHRNTIASVHPSAPPPKRPNGGRSLSAPAAAGPKVQPRRGISLPARAQFNSQTRSARRRSFIGKRDAFAPLPDMPASGIRELPASMTMSSLPNAKMPPSLWTRPRPLATSSPAAVPSSSTRTDIAVPGKTSGMIAAGTSSTQPAKAPVLPALSSTPVDGSEMQPSLKPKPSDYVKILNASGRGSTHLGVVHSVREPRIWNKNKDTEVFDYDSGGKKWYSSEAQLMPASKDILERKKPSAAGMPARAGEYDDRDRPPFSVSV